MTIERGIKRFKRKNAQNFIQDVANKRIEETVNPLNEKSKNSLDVNAHDAIIYTSNSSGPTCTCEETKVYKNETQKSEGIPDHTAASSDDENVFKIDRSYNLFGEQGLHHTDEDEIDLDERAEDILNQEPTKIIDNILAGSNEDCGICYSKAKVPGYTPYMWQREVLESHFIMNYKGFWIDTSTSPHTFKKQDSEGFVEFVISVPKYWNKCLFSVRNNREILKENLFVGHNVLTKPILDANRGKTLNILVRADEWTHAVIAFDSGVPIRVNISEINQAKDYTLFEYYSSLTAVIPPEISKISISDVIVLPTLNLVLKVSDISRKRTAKLSKYAEWSAQTRVLQPQEALRHIHRGTKL